MKAFTKKTYSCHNCRRAHTISPRRFGRSWQIIAAIACVFHEVYDAAHLGGR